MLYCSHCKKILKGTENFCEGCGTKLGQGKENTWVNSRIKGQISEILFEELFIRLGFLVLKTGQEHTVKPITQIEKFIAECGGQFRLNRKDPKEFGELEYVRKLPDFLIVNKTGRVDLIEIKYRREGKLKDSDLNSLRLYSQSEIFLVSANEERKFHIIYLESNEEPTTMEIRKWLKKEFDIENEIIIAEFEKYVENWYEGK